MSPREGPAVSVLDIEGPPADRLDHLIESGTWIEIPASLGRAAFVAAVGVVMGGMMGRILWVLGEVVATAWTRDFTLVAVTMLVMAVPFTFFLGLFAWLALTGLRPFFGARAAWGVGPDGIIDRSEPGAPHIFAWEDILGADRVESAVSVGLRDGVAPEPGRLHRWIERWRPRPWSGHLLAGGALEADTVDALVALIERRARGSGSGPGPGESDQGPVRKG